MAAYALNPKWYVMRHGRVALIENAEVKRGFMKAIRNMYSIDEAQTIHDQ